MTEHVCAYCRDVIEKPEEGVFDRLSERYFHNAEGCPYKDKDLPRLPEIDVVKGGVTCYNLYNLVNFEAVGFNLAPLTELDQLNEE